MAGPVTQDIVFQGLAAPLRLHGADAVLSILPDVAVGWHYEVRRPDFLTAPFFEIRAEPGEALLLCQCHVESRPPQRLDPVNALCDAMAALAQALPAEDQGLLCLHAAGVAIAGRLVVFPNVRRAGKTTLSVALARAGHALYGDDVLPLSFTADNRTMGHAMGIAPRLRLPLPMTIAKEFRVWVDGLGGPSNRQYKYVRLDRQPDHGSALPVGAFVILDRQEAPVPAVLAPISSDIAMDVLLHQNFTRDRHSAEILQAMAATLSELQVFQLAYSDLDDAVACLGAAFRHWSDPEPPPVPGPALRFRLAEFGNRHRSSLAPDAPLRQTTGTVARVIGDVLYVADAEGRAIHRMDPLAAAIWDILEEPVRPPALASVLAEAFPDAGCDRISADLRHLLDHLVHVGLIEADPEG